MNKKIIRAGIILLALAALISCQPKSIYLPTVPGQIDPGTETTYTVTVVFGHEGATDEILSDQTVLTKPENPTWDADHEFAYWSIDGVKVEDDQWGTRLQGDVTLTAVWVSVYDGLGNIPQLAGTFESKDEKSFSYRFNTVVNFDGEGLVKIRKWQDVYTSENLTLQGITFEKGLSIHAENTEGNDITITVEDCVINACNQEDFRDVSDRPGRIDNSGDGLCLGIDSSTSNDPNAEVNQNRGEVSVIVKNNQLIGGNNPDAERNGYETLDDLDGNNIRGRWKSRGNGVALGLQSGGTVHLKDALIEGNTFTGLLGHAIQLYEISGGTTVNITGNSFESWGINKNNLAHEKDIADYAIRGDLKDGNLGEVKLSGNTYASTVNGNFDVSERKVAIERWNGTKPNYEQSVAE